MDWSKRHNKRLVKFLKDNDMSFVLKISWVPVINTIHVFVFGFIFITSGFSLEKMKMPEKKSKN